MSLETSLEQRRRSLSDYKDWTLWEWERNFNFALMEMERLGVNVNQELARSEYDLGVATMDAVTRELGICPSGTKNLHKLLIEDLGLPLVEPTDGTRKLPRDQWVPSFNKKAMEEYDLILRHKDPDNDTAKRILTYRGWQKSTSTFFRAFLDKVCPDGRLRTSFRIDKTVTTRLSSHDPNLQQIPQTRDESKRWNMHTKQCIIAAEEFDLFEFDYNNLELRLAAEYSQEPNLLKPFREGTKIWDYMSRLLSEHDPLHSDKNSTKTKTYSILYGCTEVRLANVFGVSNTDGRKIINGYYKVFPRLRYIGNSKKSDYGLIQQMAADTGYTKLWTGRRRHYQFNSEIRKAFNSLLQGGAAEIVKRAIVRLRKEVCDANCRMVLTIHDSIVLEIRKGMGHIYLPHIKRIMEDMPDSFSLPFTVEVHLWGTDKAITL